MGYDDPSNAAAAKVGMKDTINCLMKLEKKQVILTSVMKKYAAAQAWLTDSSLFLPAMSSSGAAPFISRVVPFSASYSQSGDKASDVYFKYVQLQDKVVTKADYEQAREKWLKEKKESNEKVQKELTKHVK